MPNDHALLSPSSAHTWIACPPSARLGENMPDKAGKDAAIGTLAHSVSELYARKKFTVMKPSVYNKELKALKADPLWDDEMTTTATTYVEHLLERYMSFENKPYIVFEVRVDITDFVPEAFGRCDCIIIGGEELIITDYKHGQGVPVSPEGNPQMMLYALGALKLYRPIYGEAIKRVSVYIDQPRLHSYDGYTLTVEELLAWGETTVKPKAALAHMGMGEFSPGPKQCRFCKAKPQCRACADGFTALEAYKDFKAIPGSLAADLVAIGHEHNVPDIPPLLTDAEIGDLLTRGEALTDWYNSLKEYAQDAILNGGSIPGYKVVEGTSKATFAPDYDTAAEVLIKAGYAKSTLYRDQPETLSNLDKLVGGRPKLQEILGQHLYKPPGKPALVPITDKRPPFVKSAAADFKEATA